MLIFLRTGGRLNPVINGQKVRIFAPAEIEAEI